MGGPETATEAPADGANGGAGKVVVKPPAQPGDDASYKGATTGRQRKKVNYNVEDEEDSFGLSDDTASSSSADDDKWRKKTQKTDKKAASPKKAPKGHLNHRTGKRTVYNHDDSDETDSDDLLSSDEVRKREAKQKAQDDRVVVEKIFARRDQMFDDGKGGKKREYSDDGTAVQQFYVKWKGMSHLHCQWIDQAVLLQEKQGKTKIKRFLDKEARGQTLVAAPGEDDEDLEYFPPEFTEVDRILDKRIERNQDGKEVVSYLVKWQALQYESATWEFVDDINDDAKIAQFKKVNKITDEMRAYDPKKKIVRPPPESWTQLTKSPDYKGGNQLRPYQLQGLNWLEFNWYQGRSSILADEMGLGKTVQSISFCQQLRAGHGVLGPFLIVAPLSTLPHWQREAEGWTDLNAIVYHGSATSRKMMRQHEWRYHDTNGAVIPDRYKFHILITSYEVINQDTRILSPIPWKLLVVDEAHRLKNDTSKLSLALRQFKFEHQVLLTGTPLQNNTEELYNLLNFLEPKKFADRADFMDKFGSLEDTEQVEKLHTILRPHLLRRMKEDVERSIAPKEETIVEVELSSTQKKYYRAIYERNFSFLRKGVKSNNVPNLVNIMMELRKICNHPYLVKGVEERETAGFSAKDVHEHLINVSAKTSLLDKLLPRLKADGHRVLIFSQMVRVLDILEDYVRFRGYGYERIDGRVRGNDRQAAIDRYSREGSDKFVFLLCTRAGGLGINLTAADTVIIYDSDWNPQNDLQAQARCHRIGQKKSVKIYRLITRGTYERVMFDIASMKLGLDKAVLSKMSADGASNVNPSKLTKSGTDPTTKLDKAEIDKLLKLGAITVFHDDDGKEDNAMGEEDIDKILQRAQVITHGGKEEDRAPSSFSKASFVAKGADQDLDVMDPEFWTKALPQAAAEEAERLAGPQYEILGPRVRKQVTRLGQGDADGDDEDIFGRRETEKWNNAERRRMLLALMNLGWGRWSQIRDLCRATRGEQEVADYASAIFYLCKRRIDRDQYQRYEETLTSHELFKVPEGAEEGAPKQFPEELRAFIPPILSDVPPSIDKSLTENSVLEYLDRIAKKVMRRIFILCNLRLAIYRDGEKWKAPDMSRYNFLHFWEPEDDTKLIHGVMKHGYGKYNAILADDTFGFNKRFYQRERGGMHAKKKPVPEGEEGDAGADATDANGDVEMKEAGGETPAVTASDAKPADGADADKAGAAKEAGATDTAKTEAAPAATADASKDTKPSDDNDDADNGDDDASDDDNEDDETDDDSGEEEDDEVLIDGKRQWPMIRTLNHRVEKIFSEVRKSADRVARALRKKLRAESRKAEVDERAQARAAEREARRAEKKAQRAKEKNDRIAQLAQERARRKYEVTEDWARRERVEFRNALMAFGLYLKNEPEKPLIEEDPCVKLDGEPLPVADRPLVDIPIEELETTKEDERLGMLWSEFRSKSGHMWKKAPFQLEAYAKDFMAACREALAARAKEKSEKEAAKEAEGGEGGDKADDKAKKEDKKSDDADKKKAGRDIGNLNEDGSAPSYQYAAKLFERLQLMHQLRNKYLKHEHTEMVVSWMHSTQVLPTWWTTAQDMALLRGCEKHGYGAWSEIRSDPDLPGFAEHINDWEAVRTGVPGPPPSIKRGGTIVTAAKGATPTREGGDGNGDDEKTGDEVKAKAAKSESTDGVKKEEPVDTKTEGDAKPEPMDVDKTPSKEEGDAAKPKEGADTPAAAASTTPSKTPANSEKNIVKFYRDMDTRIQKRFERVCAFLAANLPAIGEVPVRQVAIPRASASGKRKRQGKLKEGGGSEKKKRSSVPRRGKFEVPRDENGKPIFPIIVNGSTSIVDLGRVEYQSPHFHTKKYIWPVGFKSTRPYNSMRNITTRITYTCEILDIGDKPHFKVTPEDDEDNPVVGETATRVWSTVVKCVNDQKDADNKRTFVSVSGPEWFGFSNPAVAKLIEELPDVDKCSWYQMKYQNMGKEGEEDGAPAAAAAAAGDKDKSGLKIKINPFSLAASTKKKNQDKKDADATDDDETDDESDASEAKKEAPSTPSGKGKGTSAKKAATPKSGGTKRKAAVSPKSGSSKKKGKKA